MKVRVNNKKVLIVMLILLMLILAVGYAVFSEVLTIQGTANAKGTFELEFQNAEVVKNIGVNIENTTAEISEDKNTLTVNVADLSYPGAGVEFSVDIVNVGTMPAKVHSVTPTNITGSDKIKVTGLEGIKVGHPKLEVGDKCNIHFTVEWPIDVIEILDDESNISFGLQIEYAQSTGAGGEVIPDYTVPTGLTATYGQTLSDIQLPEGFSFQDSLETPVGNAGTNKFKVTYTSEDGVEVTDIEVLIEVRYVTLVSQITAQDYGKSVDYVATVNNTQVSNWKVLYNDKNNVYLILDDFLPNSLVPSSTGLNKSGTYNIYSSTSRDVLLKGLSTESYWSEFANGVEGATAKGGASLRELISSHNEKYGTNCKPDSSAGGFQLNISDTLYVPHQVAQQGAYFYWLTDESLYFPANLYCILLQAYNSYKYGSVQTNPYYRNDDKGVGVRPMVKLPSTSVGIVGEIVEIK